MELAKIFEEKVVVFYFDHEWIEQQKMGYMLQRLSNNPAIKTGAKGVTFLFLQADHVPKHFVKEMGVRRAPLLMIFMDGKEIRRSKEVFRDVYQLIKFING